MNKILSGSAIYCLLAVVSVGFASAKSVIAETTVVSASSPVLTVNDFKFDGPLGSQGATIEEAAPNHFKISLSHAPEQSGWSNILYFQIMRNAKGNAPRIDVSFSGGNQYRFNANSATWSCDGEHWQPIAWVNPDDPQVEGDSLLFPEFSEDTVWFGAQVPMSYENVVQMMNRWSTQPHAEVHILGKSLGGRNIYRLVITDPDGPAAPAKRWVHRFANEHPGEHNAQWRMVGMIEWLLSEAGADCRRRSICHFILMMAPDGPGNGWYRVNAQGIDMNRSYFAEGADPDKQAHEACIVQKDLESLMASDHPVTTSWSLHTWFGPVEPIFELGPEFGTTVGPFKKLKQIVAKNDPKGLIKPLAIRKTQSKQDQTWWSYGPHVQFGITTVLCEGSGKWTSKQDSLDAGAILMKSIAEHYH